MLHETHVLDINYKELGIPHNKVMPTYTTYIHDEYPAYQTVKRRPLVIICPGGGYEHHSPREGEAMAIKMLDKGYNAIVLRYSLNPNEYPCALIELATLVLMARKNVDNWNVDSDKIIVAGFSAGGHLAASLGIMWNDKKIAAILKTKTDMIRPSGMLLGYPVITSGEYAHRGSFKKLLGSQYDNLVDELSLEKKVSSDTVPAFIWHTFEDMTVPVENSLLLASAMAEAKVHVELHIFPYGSHGIGLGTQETNTKEGNKLQPECAVWPELFATWLKNLK